MTSSYDAYSCILHAERSLKPYVQASCNYSNFHFYATLPCGVGRGTPPSPEVWVPGRGCREPALPPGRRGRGASFGVWTIAAGLQRGGITVAAVREKKIWLLLFRLFPRGPAAPLNPGAIAGSKIPLNLAIAALGVFLAPTNPAQPLMSHNWFLSAPNHFTEVRINV